MPIVNQVNDFLFFVVLGVIISCIFDIFRALRKIRKENSIYVVMLQDIIFFIIITIISVLYIVSILDDEFRLYMIIAMILGICISRKIISKFLIKFYSIIFRSIRSSIKFLCVPIELIYCIICKILKKITKKCCKLFSVMINLKCKLLSVLKSKNNLRKRGLRNENESKYERKKKYKKEKKVS